MWIAEFRIGHLAESVRKPTPMQNHDQDSQSPVIDQPGPSASEDPPSPLATTGRRRTQEQGQGDLDDDWQDATPVAEAQASAVAQDRR
jgi:hypothetical protein